jgi:heat shock protein HtpX
MVMNFWEAQRKRRALTTLYITLFVILTIGIAAAAEFALRLFAQENYDPPYPVFGLIFLALTFMVAGYNYGMYRLYGGSYVAESMGAREVLPASNYFKEQQLMNIVQEMSLAAAVPMPKVYLLPAHEINAFAAGLTRENAAIAITYGALERLNRDEIQGVIAHEFGHIHNGDMVISMRLAAMIMGFFFVLFLGLRILQGTAFTSRRNGNGNGRGGNPAIIAAIILIIAGAITWFAGSILQATISRQREYLADSCSVQFTRNPEGIANALRKIANESYNDMPKTGGAYAHMYLEDRTSIFATHPPISKRIAAIEGRDK